jgi:hypothetical protein
MIGLVLFLLLALVPTPGLLAAETEPFSDEAESMREAARKAGVPEHELPLETPAQSRMRKAKREPWEQKTTSAVRHVLAVLTKEGVLVAGKRHEAPQFSITGVAVDYDARVLVECKVDSVAPFDADFFASIGGMLVDQAIGYGMLVAWIPADRLPSFAGRDEVRQVRHIDPPYTDVGAILTEGDAIHRADDARDTFSIDGTGQDTGNQRTSRLYGFRRRGYRHAGDRVGPGARCGPCILHRLPRDHRNGQRHQHPCWSSRDDDHH